MKHTDTPWDLYEETSHDYIGHYLAAGGMRIVETVCEDAVDVSLQELADAEFTHRAVNSHDELVKMLRVVAVKVERLGSHGNYARDALRNEITEEIFTVLKNATKEG